MNLTKRGMTEFLREFSDHSPHNRVSDEIALSPSCAGIRIFEHPLVGISSAQDDIYSSYKDSDIVGINYLPPSEWMSNARSVVSFFNPFTEEIRKNNRGGNYPSNEWLHGRIEGQAYVVAAAQALAEEIRTRGGKALVPVADERFKVYRQPKIYSSWSERHAAYIAGMGTFSLNRALITNKGMAGRFCSVITDVKLTPDERNYTGLYENCSLCGACQGGCPVKAINRHGKTHAPCDDFLEKIKAEHPPWYGCGKCQCGMPCESGIPRKNSRADYSVIRNVDSGN